jgi:hypothetical protein
VSDEDGDYSIDERNYINPSAKEDHYIGLRPLKTAQEEPAPDHDDEKMMNERIFDSPRSSKKEDESPRREYVSLPLSYLDDVGPHDDTVHK